MENLPSILTPDLGLLFWMLIAFLVVFGFLAIYGFPAIIKMVKERKEYIDESLRKAHEASEKLDNIKQEGDALLQEARQQQALIIKQATEMRDKIVGSAQDKANEESAKIIAEAKKQIDAEKQTAIREIREQVAQLSIEISEKVLREKLSSNEEQMQLINRILDDIIVER